MKSSQQLVLALASNLALLATVSAAPASVHAKTIDWQWCAPEDKDNPELCPTAVSFPPEVPNDIGDITVPVPDPIFTPPPGPIEWPTPEPTPGQEPEPVTVITILKPTPGKEDALLTLLRDGWAKGASDSGGLLADEARPAKDLDGKDKGWVWREVFETSEDLDRWKDSPEFQKLVGTVREEGLLVEKTDVFVLGEVIEGFFPEEQEEEEAGDVER